MSSDNALFTTAGTSPTIGINLGSKSISLGQVIVSSGARTIGDSSGTSGTMTLFGANGVILSNTTASSLFTLTAQTGSQSGVMSVVLGATGQQINVTNAAAQITIDTIVSDGGNARGFIKTGAGTLVLSGSNSFTGGLTLNAGSVELGSAAALNSTTPNAVTFGSASTGVLRLNGNSVTISSLNSNATVGTPAVENGNSTAVLLTVNGAADSTYAGVLRDGKTVNNNASAALKLTKTGAGVLTLSGANVYTGVTSIGTGATIKLGNAAGLGSSVSGTSIASGGVLDLNGQTSAEPITNVIGTGILSGGEIINSNASTAATLSGAISLDGATTVGGAGSFTLSGNISGSGGNAYTLTKVGTGKLTLSGSNSFGDAAINLGTLSISDFPTNLGVGDVTVNGGAFEFARSTSQANTLGYVFTMGPNGGNISVANAAATADLNNAGAKASALAGSGMLTKAGPGTLLLSAANSTFSGPITVNGGTLATSNASALGTNTTAITLSNGAALSYRYAPAVVITRGLSLGTGGGAVDTGSNSSSMSGTITGSGAFTKYGSGALTLTGTNGYTGSTSISGGTLFVNGKHTGGTAYTVGANATLAGAGDGSATGLIDTQVNVSASGTIAPGATASSIGNLTVASFTLDPAATIAFDVNAPAASGAAGITNDRLTTTTTVANLGSSPTGGALLSLATLTSTSYFTTLDVNNNDTGGQYKGGIKLKLVDISGDGTSPKATGTFKFNGASLNEGSQFDALGTRFSISYGGGDGNDIEITTVPEPTTIALLGPAFAGLLLRRRRSQHS